MLAFGISLIALFYFGAGAMLGTALDEWLRGRGGDFLQQTIPLWFTIGANVLGPPCLWLLWRRREMDVPIRLGDGRLSLRSLCIRGLPVNHRVMFLLGAVLWLGGFTISLVFSGPR